MVRTEVKISMKKTYSACLYFKLLKSYTQTNAYTTKKNKIIINKKKTKEEAENSY